MMLIAIPVGIGLARPRPQRVDFLAHISLWRLMADEIANGLAEIWATLAQRRTPRRADRGASRRAPRRADRRTQRGA